MHLLCCDFSYKLGLTPPQLTSSSNASFVSGHRYVNATKALLLLYIYLFLSLRFFSLSDHRKVIFEKQWFFLDNAVGHLYRTTFEIVSGGILQLQKPKCTESPAGVYTASYHTPHKPWVKQETLATLSFSLWVMSWRSQMRRRRAQTTGT